MHYCQQHNALAHFRRAYHYLEGVIDGTMVDEEIGHGRYERLSRDEMIAASELIALAARLIETATNEDDEVCWADATEVREWLEGRERENEREWRAREALERD